MITILMATFNGESYLDEQLESIMSQTYQNFKVVIQDDYSTDSTYNILLKWKQKFPEKILLLQRESNSGSAKINFMELMIEYQNDYIMLADQDDVWLPDKIAKTFHKMKEMENRYGKETPILVHTDLKVVDEQLNIINESYEKAANANFERTKLKHILVQNVAAGCTAMYNRALAEYLIILPEYFVMHDWWIALIACSFGRISHIDDQLILYRQHDNNEMGAVSARSVSYQIKRFINNDAVKQSLMHTYLQAKSFYDQHKSNLSEDQKNLIWEYSQIPTKPKIVRVFTICRLGTIKNGLSRKIANFLFI